MLDILHECAGPPARISRTLGFVAQIGCQAALNCSDPRLARPLAALLDLDLGNPLQDVLGFVVHMGELLDGKPTNHLELRKALAKSKAGGFLYYKVTEG